MVPSYAQEISDNNSKSDKKKDENRKDSKDEIKEKREKIEEKKQELENFAEKLRKLKEKYQDEIQQLSSAKLNSKQIKKLDKQFYEKSDKILERLEAKSEKLDSRTQKLLEKINEGKYMGEKITANNNHTKFELVFNSVSAYGIGNKTQTSTLLGTMNFTTFDSSNSNLKLELEECHLLIDDVPYNCGFGKARTTSFGEFYKNNSLVIIAFLEDGLENEIHTTLKIFLTSDVPISQTKNSVVEILDPQSKISHLWFLNGTAILNQLSSIIDNSDVENKTGKEITINLKENISMSDK